LHCGATQNEEARTDHNPGEIVLESAALHRVLKQVEACAPINPGIVVPSLARLFVRVGDGKE
jgi:hypothetical protein